MTSDADWHQHNQPEPAQQEQTRQDHSETAQNEAHGDGADAPPGVQEASPPEPTYRGDGGVQVRSYAGGQSAGGNGYDASEHAASMAVGEVESAGTPIDFEYNEDVPGYEPAASDCLNRALQIARSLNHTSLSADHLMLALTMDQNARKLLERAGSINDLRETAMQRLGAMNWKFSRPSGPDIHFPAQTSDLESVRKLALQAASERDQRVAISDLINAFPREDGRLAYGIREEFDVPTAIERIESGLMPRFSEFMSRFQNDLRDGMHRELATLMREVAEPQMRAAVQRQAAAMEDINRQFRGLLEGHLGTVLREFKERLIDELEAVEPQPEPQPEADDTLPVGPDPVAGNEYSSTTTTIAPTNGESTPRRYWNWVALI